MPRDAGELRGGLEDYADVQESLERGRGQRGRGRRRGRRRGDAQTRGESQEGEAREGLVVTRARRNCRVRAENGDELLCYFRGRLTEDEKPVVGDRVIVRATEGREAVLQRVLPRRNTLRRVSEDDAGKVRTIAANVDLVVAVLTAEPFPPRWALADRLLAMCEVEGFEGMIVLNKIDTVAPGSREAEALEADASVYRDVGIPLLRTSATERRGLAELEAALAGRINVLSGHSGVGKSSLLNAIHPDWNLAVGHVNPLTSKGRHTTTAARLLPLPRSGWVVDTPGFREFGLGEFEPAELGRCFREFRPIIGRCRFSDCLHIREPGCALLAAVERGEVSALRYGNYRQILEGLEA